MEKKNSKTTKKVAPKKVTKKKEEKLIIEPEVIEEEVFLEEEKSIIDEIIEDNKNPDLEEYYNQIKEKNEAEENDNRLLESIKEFMMYLNSPRGGTPTVENMLKLEEYHNLWFGLNYKILCCNNLQTKVYDKMMRLVGLK